ncbi:hypothetical protein ACFVS9_28515 [Streptomyces sp. NPDC058008]|uniref:hypothetical protein n=1 Tax=Streptomyces sp. NPDC058008 TaxID=3346303 RepID=UPI0036EB9981
MTDTPLTPDREQEIRTLDLLELMSDRAAPVISGHLAVLLAEVDRLRARVTELEARLRNATTGTDLVCSRFPDTCPNIRTVPAEPPTHLGGIRCGCADALTAPKES